MGKKSKPVSLILFLISVLFLLQACSASPPELLDIFWQLDVVLPLDQDAQREELSLFILANDSDGLEDLAELQVLHSEQELEWSLSADEWRSVQRDGEVWIGGSGFQMQNGAAFPRGRYTITVSDKAGDSTKSHFTLNNQIVGLSRGDLPYSSFPSIQIRGSLQISAPSPQVSVLLYRRDGGLLDSQTMQTGSLSRDVLENWKERQVQRVWLHSYQAEKGYGCVSGPFELQGE